MLHRITAIVGLALIFGLPGAFGQGKKTKITIQLRGVLGKKSAVAFQKALAGVKGVKFKATDIAKGKEPRFFSDPFVVEVADLKKTTLGAIAKAAHTAKTPVRDDLKPGINLIVYSLDAISERTIVRIRNNLVDVKGISVRERGALGASITNSYYWIRLDRDGKARLSDILRGIRASGIKISLTDPSP